LKRIALAFVAFALFAGGVAAQAPNPVPQPRATTAATVGPTPPGPTATVTLPQARATAPPTGLRLLFFGDSISTEIDHWHDHVTTDLGGVRVNPGAAIGGSTLIHVGDAACAAIPCGIDRFPADVLAYRWDRLAIEFGRNDSSRLYPDDLGAPDGYIHMADAPDQRARTLVLGMPYLPVNTVAWGAAHGDCFAYFTDMGRCMDEITEREAGRYGAHYVSLAGMTSAMVQDGVHPNALGDALIEGRVLRTIIPNPKGR
jgi:hypothetical protein